MFNEERIGEILQQLSTLRYPEKVALSGWQMCKTDGETRPVPGDDNRNWVDVPEGSVWGGHFEYNAFRGKVTIPAEFAGKPVEFTLLTGREGRWDATNPQFTVYVNGQLRQGFDTNHGELPLTDCAAGGEEYEIFLSAFTGTDGFHLVFQPGLRTVDKTLDKFYYDLKVLWQTATLLDPEEPAYRELMEAMLHAISLLDMRKEGSRQFLDSVREADTYLEEKFYTRKRPSEATVACLGHTHIDVAWLWTLAVTEDKAVRSFSTVLELMKRYPEYTFMSSQPQLYKYVKKNAPQIYQQIKERIAEGRWEPEGGMWLEPDCNLASGEALVRQFMYGKRFFREEFGKDNQILWLPDVFGYSAALPQIMDKCGIRYFVTSKISWNELNKMPYDTFYWKGIDGTKILSHFICTTDYSSPTRSGSTGHEVLSSFTTTYVGFLEPIQIKGCWQRYQQKELNNEVICSYGYGDGGGGPTVQMLETQRRLAYGIPGCPATEPTTALGFLQRLEKDVTGKKVPIWSGELYLEYHRATYTSMARNKKWNRKSELALANTENIGLIAKQLCGVAYPKEQLDESWEAVLRNQFHDILPGSSIFEVYEDAKAEYAKVLSFAQDRTESDLQTIADGVGKRIVFNPNGQTMSGFVTLDTSDELTHTQKTADGKYIAWAENIPAKGYAVLEDAAPASGEVSVTPSLVETPFARIRINEKGHISSWYDKQAQRELLQAGRCGNVLMTYEDKPWKYDNWNLYDYYKEKSWPVEDLVSAKVTEEGPYRYALELKWQYLDTPITETMYFYANSPRVDIHFAADWKEDQIFMKALFPLDINTTEATFEIQYGNVKRSTAVNTSWDQARFEVCHHKWMDVAENGFGVSFLNDCKYGVSVEENVVGLSLIKSGRYPNPQADREYHEAVYSVFPHTDSWQEAGTVQEAYLLNNPLRCVSGHGEGTLPQSYCPITTDSRNIMVEVVKEAENGAGTVARFYDFENRRSKPCFSLATPAKKIWLCDMLENKKTLLAENTDRFTVNVAPFGIETVLIEN